MKNMNNSNMIQCPNCKTWNYYNSEFCTNCGSRLTAFAGEWWKGYNMEPVDFSKVNRGYRDVFTSSCLFGLLSLFNLGVAIQGYILDEMYEVIGFGVVSLMVSALSIVLFRMGRKKKKEFRSIDYVEIPQRKNWLGMKYYAGGPYYIFVMAGTYASHKFGLYAAGRICLPIIYDSLKWQEKGKTLLAVLNGVPMIIDVKGRRYD